MHGLPRANDNQNRYTRRQEQRRRIDKLLRSDEADHVLARRSPTTDEAAHLMQSIKDNRVSEFGLNKLCALRLDEMHTCGEDSDVMCTFLASAVQQGRDKIAMALIRAGASPLDNAGSYKDDQIKRSLILQYPTAYVVWLLKFAEMWKCESSTCQICDNTNVEAVEMDACSHTICQRCFWSNMPKLDNLHEFAEAGQYALLLDTQVQCVACGKCTTVSEKRSSNMVQHENLLGTSPVHCKASSLEKWQLLPVGFVHTGDGEQPAPRSSKDHAQGAMHLSAIALCHLGSTRVQRNEELIKACTKSDLRRIAALVQAGEHIDYQDEYGMTAVMLCAWLGHVQALKLLLAAGADAHLRDALGNTALTIATHAGHPNMVQALCSLEGQCADTPHTAEHTTSVQHSERSAGKFAKRVMVNTLPEGITSLFKQSHVCTTGCPAEKTPMITVLIPQLPNIRCDTEASIARDGAAAEYWSQDGVKGAEKGAFCLDHCFPDRFLDSLLKIFRALPVAPSEKTHCAARSYFCDVHGDIAASIESVVVGALREVAGLAGGTGAGEVKVFPQMRFMHYQHAGSALAPHVDLHRKDIRRYASRGEREGPPFVHPESPSDTSTHTMILYLTDCQVGGGETALRKSLKNHQATSTDVTEACLGENNPYLACVTPRYGRLLLFPHNCPHEGMAILAGDPKILLRGEVYLS